MILQLSDFLVTPACPEPWVPKQSKSPGSRSNCQGDCLFLNDHDSILSVPPHFSPLMFRTPPPHLSRQERPKAAAARGAGSSPGAGAGSDSDLNVQRKPKKRPKDPTERRRVSGSAGGSTRWFDHEVWKPPRHAWRCSYSYV